MDSGRHILTEEDKYLLNQIEVVMIHNIKSLRDSGVRKANIEIELLKVIKRELSKENE